MNIHKKIEQDFQRDVYCLFGFPIDNLTLKSTEDLLKKNIAERKHVVLSTINVNWVVTSLKNPEFRAAVLNSDICTLDGMPLVFLSRCIGLPMREIVAGSSLLEHLLKTGDPKNPLSIFLFGGDKETGQKAFSKINASDGGLKAVGYFYPGFGSIRTMSQEPVIQKINTSYPDILLVALGAIKGTLWIEKNRNRLNSYIISHLGATIHFLAGTVKRAPLFFQKMALEWVWRIFVEPPLLRRYIEDGLFILQIFASRFLFIIKFRRLSKWYAQKKVSTPIFISENNDWVTLKFGEQFTLTHKAFVQQTFYDAAIKNKNILLDFDYTRFVDAAFLAYLLLLLKHQKGNDKKIKVINIKKRLQEIFNLNFIPESFESLNIPINYT